MGVINYLLNNVEIFINETCGDGMTVLHSVAKRGNITLVKLFIESFGADYTIMDDVSFTLLQFNHLSLIMLFFGIRMGVLRCTMPFYIVVTWTLFAILSVSKAYLQMILLEG